VAKLVRGPIDTVAMSAGATRRDCGAVVTFLGTSRDHNAGRRVQRLEYEAYEPMALAALERLEREARSRFAIASCAITHRLGEVPLAEASVAVVVAAAHRAAAFDACRWAMEELKRTVPIWKKELFEDGGVEWVKGTALDSAERGDPG
jgi:molybdopterin synthase catalytic subunit